MGMLPNSTNDYLKQTQIFFGRPVKQDEFDEALPAARMGYVFTNWIKGKDYAQIPSITHVWQFIHYYNQYLRLSGHPVSPWQQRLTQVAMASGVGLNMIRVWTLLGPLLTREETDVEGVVQAGSLKSWDKKILEGCYWVFSVVIVARFAKDCGVIERSWENLFEFCDVVCVIGVGATRAYQYANQSIDPKHYFYAWMERVSVYAGVATAAFQLTTVLQVHHYVRLIDQPLLNKISLVTAVVLAFSITAGHFYKKLYINPDVISETKK